MKADGQHLPQVLALLLQDLPRRCRRTAFADPLEDDTLCTAEKALQNMYDHMSAGLQNPRWPIS